MSRTESLATLALCAAASIGAIAWGWRHARAAQLRRCRGTSAYCAPRSRFAPAGTLSTRLSVAAAAASAAHSFCSGLRVVGQWPSRRVSLGAGISRQLHGPLPAGAPLAPKALRPHLRSLFSHSIQNLLYLQSTTAMTEPPFYLRDDLDLGLAGGMARNPRSGL